MDFANRDLRDWDRRLDQERQEQLENPDGRNYRPERRINRQVSDRRISTSAGQKYDHIDDLANVVPVSPLAVDARICRHRIEATTRDWPITFRPISDRRVNDLHFPNVVGLYLATFVHTDFPERPDEFIQTLSRRVSNEHPGIPIGDIETRSKKFLCSLVRQHHFAMLLQEQFDFVIWSEKLDRAYGVDLMLIHEARAVGLAMSMDSARAHYYQRRKENRHLSLPASLPILEVSASQSEFRSGRLWLHGNNDVRKVRAFLKSLGGASAPEFPF